MDIETLDNKLKKITYKIGLLSYFIRIFKAEMKEDLTSDEFSGFLCSGIVPVILSWIDKELLEDKSGELYSLNELEEAKKYIKENSEYFS